MSSRSRLACGGATREARGMGGKGAARSGGAGGRVSAAGTRAGLAGSFFRWTRGRRNEADDIAGGNVPACVPWTRARLRLRRGRSSWLRPRGRRRDRTCVGRDWVRLDGRIGSAVGVFPGGRGRTGCRKLTGDVPAHIREELALHQPVQLVGAPVHDER
jgi:hypothetical protein